MLLFSATYSGAVNAVYVYTTHIVMSSTEYEWLALKFISFCW